MDDEFAGLTELQKLNYYYLATLRAIALQEPAKACVLFGLNRQEIDLIIRDFTADRLLQLAVNLRETPVFAPAPRDLINVLSLSPEVIAPLLGARLVSSRPHRVSK